MPIYEYDCPSCDHRFDELVPVGGAISCPRCGEEKPDRLISKFFTPHRPLPSLVGGVELPQEVAVERPEEKSAPPTAIFTNCTIQSCDTGLKIGPGAHFVSENLLVEDTKVAVDNQGIFEDTGTVIK